MSAVRRLQARTEAMKATGLIPAGYSVQDKPPSVAPCVHRGEPTGEIVTCPTCTGRVSLKVFACAVHQKCTPGKQVPGVACCQMCPDYSPDAVGQPD